MNSRSQLKTFGAIGEQTDGITCSPSDLITAIRKNRNYYGLLNVFTPIKILPVQTSPTSTNLIDFRPGTSTELAPQGF